MSETSPHVRRIAVHPIKSLDPLAVEESTIVPTGSLEYDREFAIVDEDGEFVNGKRTPKVHRIRATYDFGPDRRWVTFRREGDDEQVRFDLLDEREAAEAWLSDVFGIPTELRRRTEGGYPDRTEYPAGPTVISTGTVREVASWFDITPDEARLRFRANVEIEGVPPFWEDRLYTASGEEVRFDVGDVPFAGVKPTPRCIVPVRDPHTGEKTPGFEQTFVRKRRETYPDWGDERALDHFFHLMVNTHVPESAVGESVAVGDAVTVRDDAERRGPPL